MGSRRAGRSRAPFRRVVDAHGFEVGLLRGERVEAARQLVVAEEAAGTGLVAGAPVEVLEVVSGRSGEVVTAAPGDHVDDEAGTHRVLGLRAAGLDRHVFHHVGVHPDVGDLRVGVAGRRHALELDHVGEVLGRVSEIDHPTGAVVEGTGVHAGGHLEEVAPVAAGLDGQVALEVTLDGQNVAGTGDLKHRCLGGHGDRLLHSADGHHRVHTDVGAGADEDAFLSVGGEAR